MNQFYQESLLAAGYDEKSEMYRQVKNLIDGEAAKVRYRKRLREQLEISVNMLSSFSDEYGHSEDFIAADCDPAEIVAHQIEMEAFRECLLSLSDDDLKFLMTCIQERGAMARIEQETGVSHSSLSYRKKKLYKKIRQMMEEKGY